MLSTYVVVLARSLSFRFLSSFFMAHGTNQISYFVSKYLRCFVFVVRVIRRALDWVRSASHVSRHLQLLLVRAFRVLYAMLIFDGVLAISVTVR